MNKEGASPPTTIAEQTTSVILQLRQEMIRLYGEGFCGNEPYWETDPAGAVSVELEEVKNDPNLFISASFLDDDTLAGFLIAASVDPRRFRGMLNERKLQQLTENDAYLLELSVDKRFRREGIGSQLVEMALTHAGKMEKGGVTLRADLRNIPAIRLYRKLGFGSLAEGVDTNPFDVYIRKNLIESASARTSEVNVRCVRELFNNYPIAEYLFFTSPDEIVGWRCTTRSEIIPSQLEYDGKQWQPSPTEVSGNSLKTVWIAKR